MTGRLVPVSRGELVRRLRKLGWEGPISGKRHQVMRKGRHKVPIPNPGHRGDVGTGLLNEILRQADITRDAWLDAGN